MKLSEMLQERPFSRDFVEMLNGAREEGEVVYTNYMMFGFNFMLKEIKPKKSEQ